MRLYDQSTSRRRILRAQINWSRELTFSERQVNYVLDNVPNARGVYCIYLKTRLLAYDSSDWPTRRWSPVVYIGSGWLDQRLCAHLRYKKNGTLAEYLEAYELAYRYALIFDNDNFQDWPRTVEAGLLYCFKQRFGELPPANRREELLPAMELDQFILSESGNFRILKRG